MEYTAIISLMPSILGLINSMIQKYFSDQKRIGKQLKGTGIKEKLEALKTKLDEIIQFKSVLLFYAKFLPDAASLYTLSDKLSEMIQVSMSKLENEDEPLIYDSTWHTIAIMYNGLKNQQGSQLISGIDNCPVSANSEEAKHVNRLLRELENEFGKTDAYLNSRNTSLLLAQAQNINQISRDLKNLIQKQTEEIISSISL